MTTQTFHHHHGDRPHHDWKSAKYVQEWIDGDVTKDAERIPILRRMLSMSGLPHDAQLQVLDVGAGYGIFSRLVLEAFPNASVTLQDFSAPMLQQSRERLAALSGRTAFVLADLTDPAWPNHVRGPFDLAVSAIAVHNLGTEERIRPVYTRIFEVLNSGGAFVDSDYVFAGGLEGHLRWLKQAGFERISGEMVNERLASMIAYKPN
jgi:ubiquinone/menaquinone biosynthesis C-methylase UbiE